MFEFKKEVRNLKRLNEILSILVEEGFGYLIDRAKLRKRLKRRSKKKEEVPPEVRLRRTLERLGPTFIKFGQVLSVRPDLVPKNYIRELEKLQDHVAPFPFSEVKKQIETELNKPLHAIFSKFEKKPLASASISQVHKAVLKNGTIVAVKVQRPNVEEVMREDIEIMLHLASLAEKHIEKIRKYKPLNIVREFAEWTKNELDFLLEARNAKIFALNFKGSKDVVIPEVYDEYTTKKVLTLEFIDGIELNNIVALKKELKRRKANPELLIKKGFNAILAQVFLHGFFHADPHPGNIIVTKNNSIAFVDFGIIGRFDNDLKEKTTDLLYGVVFYDVDKIATTLVDMGMEGESNITGFKEEVRTIIEPLQESSIGEAKLSSTIESILHLSMEYNLQIPRQFVLFGKTLVTLEGIGLKYNPNFKLIDSARPFVENLMLRRLNPLNIMQSFAKNSLKLGRFMETFPDEATKALKKIQKGTIKVDLSDTDIKKLSVEIDRSSNRIAYSMLLAAFIIAGSVTIGMDMGPRIFDLPIVSFLSFSFAAVFAAILLISILNEER
jgi:ubiquinone biosynthesis protein